MKDTAHAAAFLICDCCGATREISGPDQGAMDAAAAAAGYAIARTTIEAHGRCAACRRSHDHGRGADVPAPSTQRADRQPLGRGPDVRDGFRRPEPARRSDLLPRQRLQRRHLPQPAVAPVGQSADLGAGSARPRRVGPAGVRPAQDQLAGPPRRPAGPDRGHRRPAGGPGRPFDGWHRLAAGGGRTAGSGVEPGPVRSGDLETPRSSPSTCPSPTG
jgi:hypothetical protein